MQKIRQSIEEDYWKEIKKDKRYHYSLKYRRQIIAEKAEQNRSRNLNISNDDKPSEKSDQAKSNVDFDDEDFYFDEFKNQIIDIIGTLDKRSKVPEEQSIYNIEKETNSFDQRKRAIHSTDEDQDQSSMPPMKKPRKFFKNIENRLENSDEIPVKKFNDESKLIESKIYQFEDDEDESSHKVVVTKLNPPSTRDENETKQSQKIPSKQSPSDEPSRVKKPKHSRQNYRRLQMRKKFLRNYNTQLKRRRLKARKAFDRKKGRFEEKCYRCGSSDHTEDECDNIPSLNVIEIDDVKTSKASDDEKESFDEFDSSDLFFENMNDPTIDRLIEESLKLFVIEKILPEQETIVRRILCGQSTMLVAPTGFGKSLCYQIAAYCLWKHRKRITIVVSPLISLMYDQIKHFPKQFKAVCFNSSQDESTNLDAINQIHKNLAQVLFCSPECLVNGSNSINFQSLRSKIGFVCIDEAHCLVEWSINFRASYLLLFKTLRFKLSIKTILCLTATATDSTIRTICKMMNLHSDADCVGQTEIPSNLVLSVSKTESKLEDLVQLLRQKPYVDFKSIIIYCTKREETEKVAAYVRTIMQYDQSYKQFKSFIEPFHAGLTKERRQMIQNQFMKGHLRIISATIAFGMGIDKKDIRGIIHYSMPKSFENYVQEVGRAGRDGEQSFCHTFLDYEGTDLLTLQKFIYSNSVDVPDLRKLIRKVYKRCHCKILAENPDDFVCFSHPVSLPIFETEIETDIKSEVIHTILMALEEIPEFPIKVGIPYNSICRVVNFGTENDIRKLIESELFLKVGFVLSKMSKMPTKISDFQFSLTDVARNLHKNPKEIRDRLKYLGITHRNNIGIKFSNYSFYLESQGFMDDEQIETIVAEIHRKIQEFEKREITKIRYLYAKFGEFKIANVKMIADELSYVNELSQKFHKFFSQYFQRFNENNVKQMDWNLIDFSRENLFNHLPRAMKKIKDEQCLLAIKKLIDDSIEVHHKEGLNTPRKLARILQGISSPKFPSQFWRRAYTVWNRVSDIDFNDCLKLCEEAIRKYIQPVIETREKDLRSNDKEEEEKEIQLRSDDKEGEEKEIQLRSDDKEGEEKEIQLRSEQQSQKEYDPKNSESDKAESMKPENVEEDQKEKKDCEEDREMEAEQSMDYDFDFGFNLFFSDDDDF
ncbi:ATP-dependent DNA helicase Q4-like protein [Sarcoptes scabiei]|uniref:DNA 3'-5' helicase n=1 Tax=Sarcoptes scabiei TaxID=52283 RepID=A0A132AES7_SARSC|nr:ATP-dependent DNA helicase Q4-like protein [Sarcoptes scabiei]